MIKHSDERVTLNAYAACGTDAQNHAPRAKVGELTGFSPSPLSNIPNAAAVLFLFDLFFLSFANVVLLSPIRQRLDIVHSSQIPVLVALSTAITVLLLYAAGSYRRDALVRFSTAMIPLSVALGFSTVVLVPLMHFMLGAIFPGELIYRSISRCATLALLGSGISLAAGIADRLAFFAMVRRRWFQRRILVVGTGERARYIYDLFQEEKYRGFAELTFVPESALGANAVPSELPPGIDHLPDGRSVAELTSSSKIDMVVVAAEQPTIPLEPLLSCKAGGIPVCEFNTFIERETGRVDLRWVDLSWLVYSHGFEIRLLDMFLKRLTDLIVAAVMLFCALPVLTIAALAIILEDRGPVLFRQIRVTQGGRPFTLFKLRTMRLDAEKNGAQWAEKRDPRITPVGNILRRFRIDEIPQLFNVLRGEMSLVGPRPERPVFVRQLSEQIEMYNLRHSVKAGITGWAQLNYPYGASVDDARHKLEYDLFYMKHFSILRDLAILLQTGRIVFWPEGVR